MALTDEYKQAKNRKGDNVLIDLYELSNPDDSTIIRFVDNTEAITYQGELYSPIFLEKSDMKELTQGEMPTLSLQFSNVREDNTGLNLEAMINQEENFVSGWDVKIITVLNKHLAQVSSLISYWQIGDIFADHRSITFSLKIENPLRQQFPKQTFSRVCQRTFDDGEGCPYTVQGLKPGGTPFASCNFTLTNCKERFDKNRTNGSGQKIGLPILIFLNVGRNAIYE